MRKAWIIPVLSVVTLTVAFQNCGNFQTGSQLGLSGGGPGETLSIDPFTEQPASKVIDIKGELTLNVGLHAAYTSGATAQWYFRHFGASDYKALEGQTSLRLRLSGFDGDMQGDYKLIVQGPHGVFESLPASAAVKGINNGCLVSELRQLPLPVDGADGVDWTLNGYVDNDLAVGSAGDYTGNMGAASRAVDGRIGTDFALAHFKAMDAGVRVKSVAPGIVESMSDVAFDRNTDRSRSDSNYVRVRLENGFSITYDFLKKTSIPLKVGDAVTAGTIVGRVGASGPTELPQLRFVVRDCVGKVVDPIKEGLFASPPIYDAPPKQMDIFFRASEFVSIVDAKTISGLSLTSSVVGETVYYAVYLAHIKPSDAIRMDFINPSGAAVFNISVTAAGPSYSGLYLSWSSFLLNTAGTWKIRTSVNGAQVKEQDWVVRAAGT